MKIKINNKKLGFNWSPYVPHTTTKKGRGCYSCHQNIKVLGLGYGMISKNKEKILNIFNLKKDSVNFQYPLEKIIDINGNQLQKFIYPNSSPLEIRTIKKLLFF